MADHCRLFALSDCKDPAFYDDCKHSHDDCCDRCELLASTMDEIDNTLVKNESNLSDDVCEEMRFLVKQAKAQIVSWKAHILRSMHQDSARIDFLESRILFPCHPGLGHEVFATEVPREPDRLVWKTRNSLAYQCCVYESRWQNTVADILPYF